MVIKTINAEDTRSLRQLILRPHQKPEELIYPGDDDLSTVHFGLFENDILSGIASLYKDQYSGIDEPESWRLRGMATLEECRGMGFGKELMNKCIEHIRENNGKIFWCNARTTAENFYVKMGMKRIGEVFVPEGLGEHVVMFMSL
ncbi:MAG: GNAT family N-acetyltransferase [Ignavibacteria bacterium]|jgi:predicted GNAT family N-acyltransferase|nr:GNAT family N-acetyltransferase [Ignavibacteria bacterium]